MKTGVLVESYKEEGYRAIPSIRIYGEEYGRGLQCFVPACTDIVPVNMQSKVIYLARRVLKPMTGWWWIGGKMNPHETKEEAVVNNFLRETTLKLDQNRFKLVAVFDYRWKDRAQSPQEIGCHMLAYTFTVELTDEEFAYISANLDKNEYEEGAGLSAFDRERLIEEKVFPAIIDLYDQLFS